MLDDGKNKQIVVVSTVLSIVVVEAIQKNVMFKQNPLSRFI